MEPTEPSTDPSTDPTTLGRYRVLSRLRVGDVGPVLLAVDETDRNAVITVARPELAGDAGFRDRLRHEIRAIATAPPWFVAAVLDADPDADPPWLAAAHIEGPTLRAYVGSNGPLSEAGVAALAVRTVDGLVALHKAGLTHGDLTPSNVVLAEDGPRLVDAGMARAATGGPDAGTPGEMYFFGELVVFAATGRVPAGGTAPDVEALSGPLATIARGCLEADPAARPTAVQVREQLRDADNALSATVAVPAVPPLPSRSASPVQSQSQSQPSSSPPPSSAGAAWSAAAAPAPPMGPVPGPRPAGPATVIGVPVLAARPPVPARSSRRRWLPLVALIAAAVLGAGIALAAVLLLNGRGTPAVVAGPSPTAAPVPSTGSTSPTSDPADDAIDAETDPRFGTGEALFATPSRNIACRMASDEVRCDVLENNWSVPPTPLDCQLDYGSGVVLSGSGPAELLCAGDTLADPSLTVLEYGESVRYDGVVCESKEIGLSCDDSGTGHGFTVSRADYELT